MTSKKIFLALVLSLGSFLVSCNLYSPLEGGSSVLDHQEIAQACLTKGDYDCAAVEYGALPAGNLREQKLCTVYLSQSGFGLSQLVTVFKLADKKKALGTVANKILPYTAKKLEGANKALEHCKLFNNATVTGDEKSLAALLESLGYFVHCGVLMSKTTSLLGTSDADTACTTSSTYATVTAASISAAADGSISASAPGMCKADADACLADINKLSTTGLGGGMEDITQSFTQVGNQFGGAGSTSLVRLALITTL